MAKCGCGKFLVGGLSGLNGFDTGIEAGRFHVIILIIAQLNTFDMPPTTRW